MTLKSYKFRLYPTPEQISVLKEHGGCARFAWNSLLEFSKKQREITGKYPNQSALQKHLITLKSEHEFLKTAHSQPVQINAQRMVKAYSKAFSEPVKAKRATKLAEAKMSGNLKKIAQALEYGFPKFKKKSEQKDSLFYPQNFKVGKSRIFLSKIGWITMLRHRNLEGKPLFVTITQDVNHWYVSITGETKIIPREKVRLDHANIVGIDLGIKTFAVLSDGEEIANPHHLRRNLNKLKREQRKLQRRHLIETGEVRHGRKVKRPSANRVKQKEKVGILHRKVRNIRMDFLHKTSSHVIAKRDGVIIEDLDIQGMLAKNGRSQNRNTLDVSWYEFTRLLEYKASWEGKYFAKIGRYQPSSKACSVPGCTYIKPELSLRERKWVCPECGEIHDRDKNASLNVLRFGMKILHKKNTTTVGTTGSQACGSNAMAFGMKQEQVSAVSAEAPAFRQG